MLRFAEAFYIWCKEHDIEPEKFTLVLRAKDDRTYARADAAIRRSLNAVTWCGPEPLPAEIKGLKIHGVRITLATLDKR